MINQATDLQDAQDLTRSYCRNMQERPLPMAEVSLTPSITRLTTQRRAWDSNPRGA